MEQKLWKWLRIQILEKLILEIILIQWINQVDKQEEINQELIKFTNKGKIQQKQALKWIHLLRLKENMVLHIK